MKIPILNRTLNVQLSRRESSVELSIAEFINSFGDSSSSVTYKRAMGITAYWSAVKTISESIASVEFRIMKKIGPRIEIAFDHPFTELMKYGPNQLQTRFGFMELMMHDLLVHGNAYYEIGFSGSGRVMALEPLPPIGVELKKIPRHLRQVGEFPYIYYIREYDEPARRIHSQDMFHVVGFGGDPTSGHSTLKMFGKTLGMAISIDNYGKGFFDRSGMPSGILSSAEEDLNDEEIEKIKEAWNKAHGPGNSQGTAILWGSFKYSPVSIAPEHAQFLSTKINMVREVARIFNIPTTKLRDTERATYSNVEQEAIDFVIETLTPWTRRIEQTINKKLLRVPTGEYSSRFVLGSLLLGDMRTRFRAYEIAIKNRFMVIEEVRELEGFPTRPVGMRKEQELTPPDDNNNENNSLAAAIGEEVKREISDQLYELYQLKEAAEEIEHAKSNGHSKTEVPA